MSAPHPVAVQVCAASSEHTSGRGRHDAERYGPCSDHARIVEEVLAQPLHPAHVAAYAVAAARSAALIERLREEVKPGWHTNNGFRYDDTTTAYAAGRNDLLDVIRSILADAPESTPAVAAHLGDSTEPTNPKDA